MKFERGGASPGGFDLHGEAAASQRRCTSHTVTCFAAVFEGTRAGGIAGEAIKPSRLRGKATGLYYREAPRLPRGERAASEAIAIHALGEEAPHRCVEAILCEAGEPLPVEADGRKVSLAVYERDDARAAFGEARALPPVDQRQPFLFVRHEVREDEDAGSLGETPGILRLVALYEGLHEAQPTASSRTRT